MYTWKCNEYVCTVKSDGLPQNFAVKYARLTFLKASFIFVAVVLMPFFRIPHSPSCIMYCTRTYFLLCPTRRYYFLINSTGESVSLQKGGGFQKRQRESIILLRTCGYGKATMEAEVEICYSACIQYRTHIVTYWHTAWIEYRALLGVRTS